MPDESLAARLELLDQHVRDLRDAQATNFSAYENDKMLRRYTERMLHMAVDACIQIGITLLTQEGLRRPENYHDVFIVLGEHAILPQDTVDCMTALVEFRNLLVYEHSTVDDMMVYGFAKKRLNDFIDFSNAVREYLSRRDPVNSLPEEVQMGVGQMWDNRRKGQRPVEESESVDR